MAYSWVCGLEIGDLSEWTEGSGGGNIAVNTSIVRSGAYSLRITSVGPEQYMGHNVTIATTAYLRYYLYVHFTANPTVNSTNNFGPNLQGEIGSNGLMFDYSTTGGILAFIDASGVAGTVKTALAQDTWHLIEIKVVANPTAGIIEWKLNGVIQETMTGLNTGSTAVFGPFFSTMCNGAGPGTIDQYIDDIVVSDTYPGPGKGSLRQGKSGTPTYNAWTKTSSQTIDQVWNATPFSATNNASLAGTAAGAQTMLVSSFSSTQTGHGTDTIGASDTINACKVMLIAKANAASPPTFSIRRRIASVDTDTTTATLTTADVFYETAPFTTTLTNLNSSEIGANRAATGTTKTVTVEDCWIYCDYTPAAVAAVPVGSLGLLRVGR